MTDHDGAQPGEEAELEVRKRLAARRAAAEEAEVDAIRGQVQAEAADAERRAELARQLDEAQMRALQAHEHIAALDRELSFAIEAVVGIVNQMIEHRAAVSRGLEFESYAGRDGRLQRPLVRSGLRVNAGHAARLLRAGREVAALGGVGLEKAEIDSQQMSRLA